MPRGGFNRERSQTRMHREVCADPAELDSRPELVRLEREYFYKLALCILLSSGGYELACTCVALDFTRAADDSSAIHADLYIFKFTCARLERTSLLSLFAFQLAAKFLWIRMDSLSVMVPASQF